MSDGHGAYPSKKLRAECCSSLAQNDVVDQLPERTAHAWREGVFVNPLAILRNALRWLLAVCASPFTLVEQSRGRWRTAVLIVYALLALVVCIPLVRKARLSRIPDLGDPFDVAAFRDGGSDDAFPLYQEALSRCGALRSSTGPGSVSLFNRVLGARLNAGYATPEVEAWMASNRVARDLWLRATARSGLSYHPWDGRGFGAEWFDGGEGLDIKTGRRISVRIEGPERGLLRWLGEREVTRLEKEGDLAGAWTWYNAALRYSRHVGNAHDRRRSTSSRRAASRGVRPCRVVGLRRTCRRSPAPPRSGRRSGRRRHDAAAV